MDLPDELQSRIIPADGAMGTMLMETGILIERCFEELCVSEPDSVRGIHEQYIAAGAGLIRTNSFGANAARLAGFGFENRINEINWSAAQLAGSCARGKNVRVAGSVGPLGITAGQADARGIDREALFREQIGALLDGGVDLIFFETFADPAELLLALHVKQSLHHCPAVCSLACAEDGTLPGGVTVRETFAKLRGKDAEIVGLNCMSGAAMLRLLGEMPPGEPVAAFPSAGIPMRENGQPAKALSPAEFAETARGLAERGARLIGGCRGTTPRHIAAMARALENFNPGT